jgi:hypothetical protein
MGRATGPAYLEVETNGCLLFAAARWSNEKTFYSTWVEKDLKRVLTFARSVYTHYDFWGEAIICLQVLYPGGWTLIKDPYSLSGGTYTGTDDEILIRHQKRVQELDGSELIQDIMRELYRAFGVLTYPQRTPAS